MTTLPQSMTYRVPETSNVYMGEGVSRYGLLSLSLSLLRFFFNNDVFIHNSLTLSVLIVNLLLKWYFQKTVIKISGHFRLN